MWKKTLQNQCISVSSTHPIKFCLHTHCSTTASCPLVHKHLIYLYSDCIVSQHDVFGDLVVCKAKDTRSLINAECVILWTCADVFHTASRNGARLAGCVPSKESDRNQRTTWGEISTKQNMERPRWCVRLVWSSVRVCLWLTLPWT